MLLQRKLKNLVCRLTIDSFPIKNVSWYICSKSKLVCRLSRYVGGRAFDPPVLFFGCMGVLYVEYIGHGIARNRVELPVLLSGRRWRVNWRGKGIFICHGQRHTIYRSEALELL
jgi:hypothetical protein